ncbi:MAG: cell wall hydrolase [Lachnospiraceae bacterium]|nr:cell wall hydrolase [Lachnospiraceae bacterium]
MKERSGGALDFFRVLSFKTYVWCIGMITCTVFLCISFFMADPYDRNVTVLKKTIQPEERATELDQTYLINTLSESGNLIAEDVGNNAQIIDTLTVKTINSFDDPYASSSESIDAYEEIPAEPVTEAVTEIEQSVLSLDDIAKSITNNQITLLESGNLPGVYNIKIGAFVSLDEYTNLCKIVEAEAASEDIEGKRLVANVVINRVDSNKFADTISEAILQDGQFAPVERGGFKKAVPTYETKQAVMTALNGVDTSEGALYFQKSRSKHWGNKEYLFRYGAHSFYK